MKKVLFVLSLLIITLFVVSCAPGESDEAIAGEAFRSKEICDNGRDDDRDKKIDCDDSDCADIGACVMVSISDATSEEEEVPETTSGIIAPPKPEEEEVIVEETVAEEEEVPKTTRGTVTPPIAPPKEEEEVIVEETVAEEEEEIPTSKPTMTSVPSSEEVSSSLECPAGTVYTTCYSSKGLLCLGKGFNLIQSILCSGTCAWDGSAGRCN
ncbi:MAG: hypothetical protein KJ597_05080 [Nanoarchaeota archaeon]|nr:hypothetical protein [Nanoarchaeota archaeon]